MVLMQHMSTRRPLVSGHPTLTRRVSVAANDSLMPTVDVDKDASREGQQPLRCRRSGVHREGQQWVGYCRPRKSAMRVLNLEVSLLAVRSRTVLALVDPKRPFTRLCASTRLTSPLMRAVRRRGRTPT